MKRGVGAFLILFLIFGFSEGEEFPAPAVFTDDPLLAPYVAELEPESRFTIREEADIVFYNGILEKEAGKKAFDYTLGMAEVLAGADRKMNPNILYSFDNLARAVDNLAQVLGFYRPERAGIYTERARLIRKRLQEEKKDSKIDKSLVLAMGELFDYLLKEMGVRKVSVDRFFIYREKAAGVIPPAQVLCESLPESDLEVQLKYRRYFPVAVKREDFRRVEDFLKAVAEEVKHGKYSGSGR